MLQLGSILHTEGLSIMVAHPQGDSLSPPHHPDFTILPLQYAAGIVLDGMLDILDIINRDRPCLEMLSALNLNSQALSPEQVELLLPNLIKQSLAKGSLP